MSDEHRQNRPEELPEPYAGRRVKLLRQHTEDVLDVRNRARQAWLEMLGREIELMVFDGFTPEAARFASTNNLALRKLALDEELETELERLTDQLRLRLQRLIEDWEDDQATD